MHGMAVGAVVHQSNKGVQQALDFYSRKLTDAQKKYSTYDRELEAMFQGVKQFRHILEGRVFHILTDH